MVEAECLNVLHFPQFFVLDKHTGITSLTKMKICITLTPCTTLGHPILIVVDAFLLNV